MTHPSDTKQANARTAEVMYTEAKNAADAILGPICAEVGRVMREAPDENMIALLYRKGVVIHAREFGRLYDATDTELSASVVPPSTAVRASHKTAADTGKGVDTSREAVEQTAQILDGELYDEGCGRYCGTLEIAASQLTSLLAEKDRLLALLKDARDQIATAPHSLGYDFTLLPKLNAALATPKAEGR